MKKLFTIAILFAVMVTAASCKKDKKETKPGNATEELLMGDWKRDRIEVRSDLHDWEDDDNSCALEIVEKYNSDYSYTLLPISSACGGNTVQGTWAYNENTKRITHTYEGAAGSYTSTLESVNEEKLVITHNADDLNNTMYRTHFTRR